MQPMQAWCSVSVMTLLEKIRSREARVGVNGLAMWGLPLAVEFAKAGLTTVAIDVDAQKVAQIARGESYIADVPSEEVRAVHERRPSSTHNRLCCAGRRRHGGYLCADAVTEDAGPGPLLHRVGGRGDREAPARWPADHPRIDDLPRPVEEVVRPKLEAAGLKAGRDFYLAFSPERVDPGNEQWTTRNIPKVVGGVDDASTRVAVALYEQVVDTVVPVSSTTVAEMVKFI